MKTAIVGLGAMGSGMATNLFQAGLLACVWNRTRAKAEAFVQERPVPVAASLAGAAGMAELILTCVSADKDLLEVSEALLPGLRAGQILVDCSTVSDTTARKIAARVADREVQFLDAPVSGGVEGARQGTLAMMVGGDAAALERARPALSAVAARILHMGPVGAGQATKAVNQIMAAGINQAVTESLAFAAAQGLDLERVIDIVGSGAAGNWFLQHRGPTLVRGRFAPGFRLALHYKDLEICQDMAASRGARLPCIELTLQHYRHLIDAGYGDEDISALYRNKRRLFEHDG